MAVYWRLNRKWKLLLLEALFELARARLLKMLPFKTAAKTLGVRRAESPSSCRDGEEQTLLEISKAVRWMARHTPWESKCMETAIAARYMLERRGIPCTLYFGAGRDPAGRFAAHAWLRSGPYVVTGAKEMRHFAPVEWFGTDPDRRGGRERIGRRRNGEG